MPTTKPAVLTLFLLAGCLDPKQLDDSGTDDTGPGADGPTVFDVNDGTVAEDTVVTLSGLVVTSPLNRDGDGFFVADPAGGPNSGLFVWRQMGMEGIAVAQGDEVRITGTPNEFYDWMEFVIGSVDDVEITGEATQPPAVDLGDGAGVVWEDYESVVISLTEQTVTAVDGFNTGTLTAGIKLDDGFQYLDYDCRGSFATLTGVLFYAYEAHSLNPRADTDLGAYTVPEPEVATIASIQAGSVCGPVTVEGVVATTPAAEDDGSSTFFVQDAGGGSGLAVYTPDVVVDVAVGDVFTLSGSAEEFYEFTQLRIADTATDMELTGTGSIAVAESLAAAPTDWEPYEGALITLADLEVTAEGKFGEVETNYGIKLDTLFYENDAEMGSRFSTVTGVVYYNFSEWKIEPRDASDLVP
ncbi:MAG: hypothetical protein Q8P18_14540 [Pseudomonadota bacterium]|nr:hypothetical protein [Pseudomonadota bacterium]